MPLGQCRLRYQAHVVEAEREDGADESALGRGQGVVLLREWASFGGAAPDRDCFPVERPARTTP